MANLIIPKGYVSDLGIIETEIAIKELKDFFEADLARQLKLTRVSAPLFVEVQTGLNDNLSGTERPVEFDLIEMPGSRIQIVQSLAKWKRHALKKYNFPVGTGLYTDMNAIRRDEYTDNIHSIYVDQWDWEKVITENDRSLTYLKDIVGRIFCTLKNAESFVASKYSYIEQILPDQIAFLTSQELLDAYPGLTPKQREDAACREYGAVFIAQIGSKLTSGEPHDGRAPDYDDWGLNGDILVYNPLFDNALELSSMGIRVDAVTLRKQLELSGSMHMAELTFHKALLNDELPLTVGGGIGQSRLCMYLLRKAHIGETQASVWPAETIAECEKAGVHLL